MLVKPRFPGRYQYLVLEVADSEVCSLGASAQPTWLVR